MLINGYTIYRDAGDELHHIQDEDVTFETTESAAWWAWTGQILSYEEVLMIEQRLELAKAIIRQAQHHLAAMDENQDVLQEYWDSGSVAFTDEEVAELGLTAVEVNACLTLLENAGKFYGGTNPTNAIYRTTINAIRRVEL